LKCKILNAINAAHIIINRDLSKYEKLKIKNDQAGKSRLQE
jgi:hypothetical protein